MVSHVVITLLRHARTLDNEASRYSGWINSKLSEAGITEVKQLKKKYENKATLFIGIDQVYTSDLDRTIETAKHLFQDVYPTYKLKGLREMHFGDFEGLAYNELKHDLRYQTWLNHLYTYALPNGESFKQFTDRIDVSFKEIKAEIIERNLKHVVLVVHGGVIRYLLTKLTDDSRAFFEFEVPFAGGYQLESTRAVFKEENPCMSLQVVPTMENGNS